MGNTEKTADLHKALSQNDFWGCLEPSRSEKCVASDENYFERDTINRVF
jgi:hypothetical protein